MAASVSVLIIAVFCIVGFVESTPFNKCADGPPPLDLRVVGCTEFPCPFYRGTNLTAEVDFTVLEDTTTLKPRVRATVMGTTINFPFPQRNACDTLVNTHCPLDKSEDVTYSLVIPVSSAYPKIHLEVEFALLDDSGKVECCFSILSKVTNKENQAYFPQTEVIQVK